VRDPVAVPARVHAHHRLSECERVATATCPLAGVLPPSPPTPPYSYTALTMMPQPPGLLYRAATAVVGWVSRMLGGGGGGRASSSGIAPLASDGAPPGSLLSGTPVAPTATASRLSGLGLPPGEERPGLSLVGGGSAAVGAVVAVTAAAVCIGALYWGRAASRR
jgi:hypothetical protein